MTCKSALVIPLVCLGVLSGRVAFGQAQAVFSLDIAIPSEVRTEGSALNRTGIRCTMSQYISRDPKPFEYAQCILKNQRQPELYGCYIWAGRSNSFAGVGGNEDGYFLIPTLNTEGKISVNVGIFEGHFSTGSSSEGQILKDLLTEVNFDSSQELKADANNVFQSSNIMQLIPTRSGWNVSLSCTSFEETL